MEAAAGYGDSAFLKCNFFWIRMQRREYTMRSIEFTERMRERRMRSSQYQF
jgi:hypothetical protein